MIVMMKIYSTKTLDIRKCFLVICLTVSSEKASFKAYSKTCVKRPLKNGQNKDLKDKW